MKKFLRTILALMAVCFILNKPATTFAASRIEVYLNGTLINFTMGQPINYNNRVMVPAREIAERLGFTVDYIEDTSTMTCVSGGLTVVHKIETAYLTANGVNRTFDTPSMLYQDRTLMPVRMIAETLGAEFDYSDDGTVARVRITTNQNTTVNSLTFSKNSVEYGGSVDITVNANSQTTRVKLTETNNSLISELTNYTTNTDGSRTFRYTWSPKTTSASIFIPVTATPGSASAYNDAGKKTASLPVLGPPTPIINDISVKRGTITQNDTVTFTVTTNNHAEMVKISNDYDSKTVEQKTYTTSGDTRTFKIDVKMEKIGSIKLTIEVGNAYGYDSTQKKTQTVDVISKTAVAYLEIVDIVVSPTRVKPGGYATVTVTTSLSATRVRIEDSDEGVVSTKSSPTYTDDYEGTKTWEFSIRMPSDQDTKTYHYYAVAYEGSRDNVNLRFPITVSTTSSSSSDNLEIKDIYASPSTVRVKGYTEITVKTDGNVYAVALLDEDRTEIDYLTKSSGSSTKTWVFDNVYIPYSGANKFFVRAYDRYEDQYSQDSITVTGSTTSSNSSSNSNNSSYAEITKITPEETDVYYNDYVYVEVRTTNDVDMVEIYNDSGTRVARATTYTKSGSTFIWDLSFQAKITGTKVWYDVVATDDYGDEVTDEFSIRVR